jgi:hypothetical protein
MSAISHDLSQCGTLTAIDQRAGLRIPNSTRAGGYKRPAARVQLFLRGARAGESNNTIDD